MAEERTDRPRLHRSRTDRMIAGVAGGIAEYFQIDPVLVRLIFVILAFTGGGVVVYLIAWIIVPEAEEGEPAPASRGGVEADTARLLIGAALIAIGGIILAARFIPYFHVVFWPLVLVGAGIAVIAGSRR